MSKVEELKQKFEDMGVVDFSVFPGKEWPGMSIEDKAQAILDVIEAIENGESTPFEGLGDSEICED